MSDDYPFHSLEQARTVLRERYTQVLGELTAVRAKQDDGQGYREHYLGGQLMALACALGAVGDTEPLPKAPKRKTK